MPLSVRSIALLGLPLTSLAQARNLPDVSDDRAVQKLEPQGHSYLIPQERVFEEERKDTAAVDSEHVDLARQDALVKEYLRRRQDNNATTTAIATETLSTETTDQSSSSQVPASTTEPVTTEQTTQQPTTQTGILVPIVTSTTASDGSVVITTTNAFETTAQTSIVVNQTTTNDSGETIVTSATAPATIITQTNSEGSTMVTTSPVSVVSVAPGGSVIEPSGGMLTTTDQEGSTLVLSRPTSAGTFTMTGSGGRVATVTYQPGGGTVSQVRVLTTTLANGQRSTITSFAEVGVETGASGSEATGSSESGEQPGLQSGAGLASSYFAAGMALVAGAMMGAALLA